MAWSVPPSSAIIKVVGELGVLCTLRHIVEAVEHGLGGKLQSDNNVSPIKPKTTQFEGVQCWCCHAMKVVQNEHWLLCEKNHLWISFIRVDFPNRTAMKTSKQRVNIRGMMRLKCAQVMDRSSVHGRLGR